MQGVLKGEILIVGAGPIGLHHGMRTDKAWQRYASITPGTKGLDTLYCFIIDLPQIDTDLLLIHQNDSQELHLFLHEDGVVGFFSFPTSGCVSLVAGKNRQKRT